MPDPRDEADGHNRAGMAALRDPARAIGHFMRAVELRPDDTWFLSNLGVAQRRAGLPEDARQTFERALALDEKDARIHHGLANVLVDLGDAEGGLRTYVRALECDPALQSTTSAMLAHLQSMLAEAAKTGGGREAIVAAQAELQNLAPETTEEFTDKVKAGLGAGTEEKVSALFLRFLVERVAESSKLSRADDPRRIYTLFKIASEVLLLQKIQADHAAEPRIEKK